MVKRVLTSIITVAVLMGVLVACSGTTIVVAPTPEPEPIIDGTPYGEDTPIDDLEVNSDESWTILVYLMGDPDLEVFAIEDVLEMASIPSSPNLNIITLFDRSEIYTSQAILNVPDFTDTKIFQIINGELTVLMDNLCLLYTSPSPRDKRQSRMPSSA